MAAVADHNEDVYRIAQHIGPKCAELIRRAIDAGIVFAHNVEDVDEAIFLVKLCRAWLAVNSDRSLSGDTATVVNTTDVTATSGPGVTATTVGTSTPHRDPDELVRSLVEPSPRSLDISVSLTDACGNGCLHCSTCALPGGASVPFSRIGPALSGAAQFAKILHIACEGDPMFYFSEGHDIADVVSLLWGLGFSTVSVQFLPPMPAKHQVLQRLLAALETEVSNRRSAATTLPTPSSSSPTATTEENPLDEQCYHAFPPLNPVVSFNLYSPRCGITLKEAPSTRKYMISGFGTRQHSLEWFEAHMHPADFYEVPKLAQFFSDVKYTIVELAKRDLPINFELRGDPYSATTDLITTKEVLLKLLSVIEKENPSVKFPKCSMCDTVHYPIDPKTIVPLGRATTLFPNGKEKEANFFEQHVKVNTMKYLCENWGTYNAIVIDTRGYPQLCYSNLALMPHVRTTNGPNMYSPRGFAEILEFHTKMWTDRLTYIRDHLPELLRRRPNENYCPLDMFRTTNKEFLQTVCDGRTCHSFTDW